MSARKVVMKIVSISFSILILILLVFVLYRGGQMAYKFGYRVFTEKAVNLPDEGKDKVVTVSSGMGAKELGELLKKKGLIRDANLFVLQLKLSAYAKKIKEGTYTLSTSMTAQEMMQIMSAEADDTETEE
ncbi:MAG: endolytic transglycosylase MltG [Eubacterium sp.]|nr:endolytic transglycosylase MltG [Eubacterium sp.]